MGRNILNEKKTLRTYLSISLIVGIIAFAGYLFGVTEGIAVCADTAIRTLKGFGIDNGDMNELITRYMNIGRSAG